MKNIIIGVPILLGVSILGIGTAYVFKELTSDEIVKIKPTVTQPEPTYSTVVSPDVQLPITTPTVKPEVETSKPQTKKVEVPVTILDTIFSFYHDKGDLKSSYKWADFAITVNTHGETGYELVSTLVADLCNAKDTEFTEIAYLATGLLETSFALYELNFVPPTDYEQMSGDEQISAIALLAMGVHLTCPNKTDSYMTFAKNLSLAN